MSSKDRKLMIWKGYQTFLLLENLSEFHDFFEHDGLPLLHVPERLGSPWWSDLGSTSHTHIYFQTWTKVNSGRLQGVQGVLVYTLDFGSVFALTCHIFVPNRTFYLHFSVCSLHKAFEKGKTYYNLKIFQSFSFINSMIMWLHFQRALHLVQYCSFNWWSFISSRSRQCCLSFCGGAGIICARKHQSKTRQQPQNRQVIYWKAWSLHSVSHWRLSRWAGMVNF